MKKLIFPTLSLITTCFIAFSIFESHNPSYEEFVKNHEFNEVGRSKIPGMKSPDLAMEQNFLMTMNPKLKRPTPEILLEIQAKTKSNSELLGLPGDAQNTWTERGPNNIGGRTRAMLWDPNDSNGKKVFAAGVTGGLWYTDDIYDSLETWNRVTSLSENLGVTCMAADPNDSKILYLGTGEDFGGPTTRGIGIFKSTDGGTSWSRLQSTSSYHFVNDLIVRDENGTGVLYAGVRSSYYQGDWHGVEGIFQSSDGGSTFSQVAPTTENSNYVAADLELGSDGTIWAGSKSNSFLEGSGAILSSSDGLNWTVSEFSGFERVELSVAETNDQRVYALLTEDSKIGRMIVTSDQGANWTDMALPDDADDGITADDFTRGQADYDLIAQTDPNDDSTLVVGGIDLFKSTDAGQSWTQISHWYGGFGFPEVHADQHALLYKPGSSSDLLIGNDGGVSISTNADTSTPSFLLRNNNYNITQFYAVAIHPQASKDFFLAGSQDNGTQRFSKSGLQSTEEAFGGDGAFCFIDEDDPTIQIVSYVHNSYYLSTDEGQSFDDILVEDENTGSFINPAAYDSKQNVLYSGATTSSIARILDVTGAPSRSDINIDLGTRASSFLVSPYDSAGSTVFVGTQAGKLFKISNAHETSTNTDLTGDLPEGWISSIEMGATDQTIIATISNYGVNSVWLSTDGGQNWSNKEGDLPDLPVRWALINPSNENEAILATDLGIWGTTNLSNSSPTWSQIINGMENVRVDMLRLRRSDNEIIAATHGRGLFSSSAWFDSSFSLPNLSFHKPSNWDENVLITNTNNGASSTPIEDSQNFYLSFSLENSGVLEVSDAFKISVTIDNEEVYTDEITNDNALQPEDTITFEFIELEGLSEGNHEISIKLDVDGAIGESSESDNTKTTSFYIQESCQTGVIIQDKSGTITDGSGTDFYLDDRNCSWIIQPDGMDSIAISFNEFETEEGFDFLKINDGSNEIEFSGSDIPQSLALRSSETIITFVTDDSQGASGWSFNYTSIDVPDPDAPSGLTLVDVSSKFVSLEWEDNSDNEEAFILERSSDGENFSEIAEIDVDITNYADSSISDGTNYSYRVKAINMFDESPYSDELNILTPLGLEYSQFKVYPVPTRNTLTIENSSGYSGEYSIVNLSGKVLISNKISRKKESIDVSNLSPGVYFLRTAKGQIRFRKIQ